MQHNAKPIALLKRRLVPLGLSFGEDGVTSGLIGVEPGPALGAGELRNHIVRIQRAVEHDDSAQTLGSAKELLESTAKFILQERGLDEPSKFPGLMNEALSAIGLHAKAVDGDDDIALATRRILGALNQIAVGVNELRNNHGTGHGRASPTSLSLRHARLAAGSAIVLATIMIDTLEDSNAPWRRGAS